MTTYTFDESIVSDLHKDAYGFRPSQSWWAMWAAFNGDQKQAEWDHLIEVMNESMEMERLQTERALAEFKALVQKTIELGAGDEETALRWMTQDETFYHSQDVEHWVWNQGILFTDYGRELVKRLNSLVDYKEWDAA